MAIKSPGRAMMFRWVVVIAIIRVSVLATAPNYCSHVQDTLFTCDYSSMVAGSDRPIDFASFNPVPQRLLVTVNGMLPYFGENKTFSSGFAGINTAQFDPNFPAELQVDCGRGGTAYLNSGAFTYMGFVQHLKFKNCKVYNIPSSVFADIADLDYFGIENGEIDVVDPNAMTGLTVEKLTSATHSFPRKRGLFEVLYSPFSDQAIPVGLLYSWKNLTSLTIKGSAVNTLTLDTFQYNTKLRHIDLSDNGFTSLPNNVFSGLGALAEVTLYNIEWACSCDNLWFVSYANANNVTLLGDLLCANANGNTIFKYHYDNCVTSDPCDGWTGVAMGERCLSAVFLTIFVLICSSVIMTIVALVIIILLRRQLKAKDSKKRQAVGRWNKILGGAIQMQSRNRFKEPSR